MEIFIAIWEAIVAGIFIYKAIHTPSTDRTTIIGDSFSAGAWFALFIHSLISLL